MMLCMAMVAMAQPKSRIIEEGGTGPFKAIMTEVEGLAEHTLFHPQDLSQFSADRPLPVLVWGNGACSNSPWEDCLIWLSGTGNGQYSDDRRMVSGADVT